MALSKITTESLLDGEITTAKFATNVGGKVVQIVNTQSVAETSGTTVTVYDDTVVTSSEGNQMLSRTITPTHASNLLYIEGVINIGFSASGNNHIVVALFEAASANSIAAWMCNTDSAATSTPISFGYYLVAGGTSEQTYNLRVGCNAAGTIYMNRNGTQTLYAGTATSILKITEILA